MTLPSLYWTFTLSLRPYFFSVRWMGAVFRGPCVSELPYVLEVYDKHGGEDFEIIGISLDNEDKSAFLAFLEEHGMRWPQIYDGKGWQAGIGQVYRVRSIPRMLLLDRQGVIRYMGSDLRHDEEKGNQLMQRVEELLEE